MKPLSDLFNGLSESYYRIPISSNDLFSSVNSKNNCRIFINEHFIRGNKKSVFTIPESYIDEYLKNGKFQHTVSLYLLGLLLKSNISCYLRHKMNTLFKVNQWYSYEYTWYLTCLYHDITSVIEQKTNYEDREERIEKIQKSKLFKQGQKLRRFSLSLYTAYARYRSENSSLEHGIMAGTALFNALYESFKSNTKKHKWKDSPICINGGVNWRKEHVPHFAYIADAICCHNIWLAPEKDKKLCKKYSDLGLNELVVDGDKNKLSFEEYPLQFILCLLDTIEPVKRFEPDVPEIVLDNILLEAGPNEITIGWTSYIKEHPNFWDWLMPIVRISDWMKIKVSPCRHKDYYCYMTLSWESVSETSEKFTNKLCEEMQIDN